MRKNESGFTLFESLITLLIISVTAIPYYMFFINSILLIERTEKEIKQDSELILLERILRESVSSIKIPYWIDSIEITDRKNYLKVPYYLGYEDSCLELDLIDGVLRIQLPGREKLFPGYNGFNFQILKNSEMKSIGLSLELSTPGGGIIKFLCAFGSIGKIVFGDNK